MFLGVSIDGPVFRGYLAFRDHSSRTFSSLEPFVVITYSSRWKPSCVIRSAVSYRPIYITSVSSLDDFIATKGSRDEKVLLE